METSKILLFGKQGQVGYELRRTLAPLGPMVSLDYPEVDLANPDSIAQCIRNYAPELIINAAAYTAVDKAESEPELAQKINGDAPRIMAEEARRLGALLVHYSTDYVFDGQKDGLYAETDLPNPLSVYGRTKLSGEQGIQASGCHHLILRLCWVYGARGHNFMLTIMRLAREREQLRVVSDQVGSPTWSRMIAEATALITKQVSGAGKAEACTGIYHLSAGGSTSWRGFTEAIVARMPAAERKCQSVRAITTHEYPLPAKRPANSKFSCEKLRATFGLKLPSWQESLDLVLER